jgi:hypothetical protein
MAGHAREVSMRYRVAVSAACVLLLAGCQQAGQGTNSGGVTAPSSLAIKGVDVPFSGAVTGGLRLDFENPQGCKSGFTVVNDSTGTSSHMGRITYHVEQCTNPLTGAMDGKVLVLTAANGDELHGTFTGHTTPAGEAGTVLVVNAEFVFGGGTGRFRNATGAAQMSGEVTHTATFPWPGRWEWSGTIRY